MPTFVCIRVFLWYFMQLLTSLEQHTVHHREVWLEKILQVNNCNVDLQYWRRLSNLADWDLITDRRRETFAMATKPLTGMNVSDSHLNFGVGWNDPPVSPLPRNLFIKPFVYDKISRRKLSAPFPTFFFPCVFYLGENVIEKWMSPLALNEILLCLWWPYLSCLRLWWINVACWHALSLDSLTSDSDRWNWKW